MGDQIDAALERALTALANGIEAGTLTLRIDHYHHFPDPLALAHEVTKPVRVTVSDGPPWLQRPTIALSTPQEAAMTTIAITVDDVNKKLHAVWTDDKGDTGAVPPAAGALTFSVKPNADGTGGALAVSADATDPFAADYVPGPDGDSGTISGTFNGTAFEPDGVTPIPDPPDAAYTTGPGGAVSATIAQE